MLDGLDPDARREVVEGALADVRQELAPSITLRKQELPKAGGPLQRGVTERRAIDDQ
jgi:hypothetical protein